MLNLVKRFFAERKNPRASFIASALYLPFWLAGKCVERLKSMHTVSLFDEIGEGPSIDEGVEVKNRGIISAGKDLRIGAYTAIETTETGGIKIGDGVYFNRFCVIVAGQGTLTIGDHTAIGESVSIRTSNHETRKDDLISTQKTSGKDIVIGRDVWIGRGAVILPGAVIRDGAVIGANSVVNSEIPEYAIAAGTPAVVKKVRS